MRYLLSSGIFFFFFATAHAQKTDSLIVRNDSIVNVTKGIDTTLSAKPAKKQYIPRVAAIRSAIIPGWGQAYNKKYWKIPIVYGALGTTAVVFKYNLTQYKRIQYAYRLLVTKDSGNYSKVDADLQPFIKANASSDLRNYRSEFRKDIDYSVVVFIFFWGLNIVDATVDAHLKGFDVSDDLSLNIRPGYSTIANTTGLSLVMDIHKGTRPLRVLPN